MVKNCYCFNFIQITITTKNPLVLHEAVIQGKKAPVVTSKDVFPEYYMIYAEKFQDVINDDVNEWVYFFKHGEIRDDFKSPGILLAAKKLDNLMMPEDERRAYDGYLAFIGQELGILNTAKAEGREEGMIAVVIVGLLVARILLPRPSMYSVWLFKLLLF